MTDILPAQQVVVRPKIRDGWKMPVAPMCPNCKGSIMNPVAENDGGEWALAWECAECGENGDCDIDWPFANEVETASVDDLRNLGFFA